MAERHYEVGQKVRIATRFPPGHVRTPYYCRGKVGTVERVLGPFHDPEQLAYAAHAPRSLVLYRVRFSQADLWPDYEGAGTDVLELEIYESWLEAA